jgi:hypothetical protein
MDDGMDDNISKRRMRQMAYYYAILLWWMWSLV